MNKKDQWNTQYANAQCLFGDHINELLRRHEKDLPTEATILNIGDGEGFNSIYLAEQGHRVSSLDSSNIAQEKARQNAAMKNVKIEFINKDFLTWDAPQSTYDMVTLFFVHVEGALKKQLAEKMISVLKPGGRILLECFHKKQLTVSDIGPKNIDMLYDEEDIKTNFHVLENKEILINMSNTYSELQGEMPSCTLQFTGLKKSSSDS